MLQTTRNRTPLTRRGWAAVGLAALSLSLPLAAAGLAPAVIIIREPQVTPAPASMPTPIPAPPVSSEAQAGSIAGQVVDQSGGTLPGTTMTLTDRQTHQATTAITNATGRFVFRDLPAGEYSLTGTMPGFAAIAATFTLAPGDALTPRFTMGLGTLSETITVLCGPEEFSLIGALFPVLEARQASPAPIRVGGHIREPKKIRDVRPICPAGIVTSDAVVRLKGTIDDTGEMSDVLLDDEASVAPPDDLASIAMNAMRQWRFTPTQLNGQPVAVSIRVNVTFRPR